MWYYAIKVLLSASLIVAISEIAKRNSSIAALLASLPLTSLLAFIWLHLDGSSHAEIAILSKQIFWLVLPSLALFLIFPWLLKQSGYFWLSLSLAMLATSTVYLLMLWILRRFSIYI